MNRTFLCVGAGPGIGLATARRFAAEGYSIVLAAKAALPPVRNRAADRRRLRHRALRRVPVAVRGQGRHRAIAQALAGPVAARGIHIATVTVVRLVEAGWFEASAVAERFWRLHSQPRAEWTTDVVYR